MVLGVLMTTRALKKIDRPAWMRDIHSWLGGLALIFAGLHMVTLLFDSYVNFSVVDLLLPFSSEWKPIPVAIGIFSFYSLAAVQITSLMMKKMSKTTWRRIHMLSYLLFATVVLHALTSGSDVGKKIFTLFSVAITMIGAGASGIRYVLGRYVTRRAAQTAN
jgi:DMSO/TMAO reductase YedYZ heme-binding membrane subunit